MKKKMIKLFLVFSLLLLSGCTINYDLKIDENINESASALGTESVLYNAFFKKPIPLSKYAPIQSESDEKLDGVSYYETKDISSYGEYGLEFSGSFNDLAESNLLQFGVGEFSFSNNDGRVRINVPSGIKIFDQFNDLNEIKVNINCKYKSLENNADGIDGNKYTWIINRDNYKDKTINFIYDKNDGVISSNYLKDNPMITFSLALVFILMIILIIYLFVKFRFKRKNSL